MRRTHVLAVLALTLSATLLPAVSTSATPPGQHAHAATGRDSAADRALRRADEVLDGLGAGGEDATLALRDLARSLPALDPAGRRRARSMLARPTDPRDQYGDSYRTRSRRTCSTNLCVHWVPRTSDAPPSRAWVGRTMRVLKHTWSREVGGLDYRPPVRDGRRGGDGRLDVYLKDVGANGLFGYCAPERTARNSRWRASGYCVLDDDFARSQFRQAPERSLKATAAHEFFHAVQFAYDYSEDGWFMEATATWMEERVFDDVNDNRRYLPAGQLGFPGRPVDIFESFGAAQYGNWVFFEYLSRRFGSPVVREAWNAAAAVGDRPGLFSIRAIETVLPPTEAFPDVFGQYATAITAPALTFPEGVAFSEGGHWPTAPSARAHVLEEGASTANGSLSIDHLASKNVRISPGDGIEGDAGWQLRVTVRSTLPGTSRAHVLVRPLEGNVRRDDVLLDGTPVFVPFNVRWVKVTLANASTRFDCKEGTPYSCRGTAKDDGRSFKYDVEARRSG